MRSQLCSTATAQLITNYLQRLAKKSNRTDPAEQQPNTGNTHILFILLHEELLKTELKTFFFFYLKELTMQTDCVLSQMVAALLTIAFFQMKGFICRKEPKEVIQVHSE